MPAALGRRAGLDRRGVRGAAGRGRAATWPSCARGAGTKLGWGTRRGGVDLVARHPPAWTGVVEHAAGDLIVVVRAGVPLADLQATLAGAGQRLAVDAAAPGRTVGGDGRHGCQRAARGCCTARCATC